MKRTNKPGWRTIGGKKHYFKSVWEANFARFLEFLKHTEHIKSWAYENKTYWFHNIKRGVRSYLPDFEITELDGSLTLYEVKGWMDPKSKTKLKRMAKYFPEVKLYVIDKRRYKNIKRNFSQMIHDWE